MIFFLFAKGAQGGIDIRSQSSAFGVVSYMRGKYYLWTGSDGVHLWAFDGEDGWKNSGWGLSVKDWKTKRGQKPGGVRIPEPVLDEYVVMRFAELLDERKVAATIRRVFA